MAYENYARLHKFEFYGLKGFKKGTGFTLNVIMDGSVVFRFIEDTIKAIDESAKIIDTFKMKKEAGIYKRVFDDFSEVFEVISPFFSGSDALDFENDLRYFMFNKFNLHTLDINVKAAISFPTKNITKKLQALQKLYKD